MTGITVTGSTVTGITVTGVFLYTRDSDWYYWTDWCDSERRTWRHTDIQTNWYAGITDEINLTPSTGLRSYKFNFVYIFRVMLLILFIAWSYRQLCLYQPLLTNFAYTSYFDNFLFIPVT